ncbi:hypothetical protein P8C59_006274 [Phyllachora maydis]|uniref:Uncharacterized protein n=1 Tax=Phyllachora maydis TaxID=1825666 RepID=A0AAD9I646_9PEZI|nr:hypothetical protein P8C59_006274 [Phyllachora maydis]
MSSASTNDADKSRSAARAAHGVDGRTSTDGGGKKTLVVVRDFVPPQGFDRVVFGSVVMFFSLAAMVGLGYLEPGTAAWRFLEGMRLPRGPAGLRWLVNLIALPTLFIHIAEVLWLDRSRLVPHGVERGSRVWFLWLGAVFFDGVCTYKRFDRHVKALEAG